MVVDVFYLWIRFIVDIVISLVIVIVDEKFLFVGIFWWILIVWNFNVMDEKKIFVLIKVFLFVYVWIGGIVGDFVVFSDLGEKFKCFLK